MIPHLPSRCCEVRARQQRLLNRGSARQVLFQRPLFVIRKVIEAQPGKGISKQILLKSFGQVEDVSSIVTFLAGPDAKYMTGSFVTVDGGASTVLGLGSPLKK